MYNTELFDHYVIQGSLQTKFIKGKLGGYDLGGDYTRVGGGGYDANGAGENTVQ